MGASALDVNNHGNSSSRKKKRAKAAKQLELEQAELNTETGGEDQTYDGEIPNEANEVGGETVAYSPEDYERTQPDGNSFDPNGFEVEEQYARDGPTTEEFQGTPFTRNGRSNVTFAPEEHNGARRSRRKSTYGNHSEADDLEVGGQFARGRSRSTGESREQIPTERRSRRYDYEYEGDAQFSENQRAEQNRWSRPSTQPIKWWQVWDERSDGARPKLPGSVPPIEDPFRSFRSSAVPHSVSPRRSSTMTTKGVQFEPMSDPSPSYKYGPEQPSQQTLRSENPSFQETAPSYQETRDPYDAYDAPSLYDARDAQYPQSYHDTRDAQYPHSFPNARDAQYAHNARDTPETEDITAVTSTVVHSIQFRLKSRKGPKTKRFNLDLQAMQDIASLLSGCSPGDQESRGACERSVEESPVVRKCCNSTSQRHLNSQCHLQLPDSPCVSSLKTKAKRRCHSNDGAIESDNFFVQKPKLECLGQLVGTCCGRNLHNLMRRQFDAGISGLPANRSSSDSSRETSDLGSQDEPTPESPCVERVQKDFTSFCAAPQNVDITNGQHSPLAAEQSPSLQDYLPLKKSPLQAEVFPDISKVPTKKKKSRKPPTNKRQPCDFSFDANGIHLRARWPQDAAVSLCNGGGTREQGCGGCKAAFDPFAVNENPSCEHDPKSSRGACKSRGHCNSCDPDFRTNQPGISKNCCQSCSNASRAVYCASCNGALGASHDPSFQCPASHKRNTQTCQQPNLSCQRSCNKTCESSCQYSSAATCDAMCQSTAPALCQPTCEDTPPTCRTGSQQPQTDVGVCRRVSRYGENNLSCAPSCEAERLKCKEQEPSCKPCKTVTETQEPPCREENQERPCQPQVRICKPYDPVCKPCRPDRSLCRQTEPKCPPDDSLCPSKEMECKPCPPPDSHQSCKEYKSYCQPEQSEKQCKSFDAMAPCNPDTDDQCKAPKERYNSSKVKSPCHESTDNLSKCDPPTPPQANDTLGPCVEDQQKMESNQDIKDTCRPCDPNEFVSVRSKSDYNPCKDFETAKPRSPNTGEKSPNKEDDCKMSKCSTYACSTEERRDTCQSAPACKETPCSPKQSNTTRDRSMCDKDSPPSAARNSNIPCSMPYKPSDVLPDEEEDNRCKTFGTKKSLTCPGKDSSEGMKPFDLIDALEKRVDIVRPIPKRRGRKLSKQKALDNLDQGSYHVVSIGFENPALVDSEVKDPDKVQNFEGIGSISHSEISFVSLKTAFENSVGPPASEVKSFSLQQLQKTTDRQQIDNIGEATNFKDSEKLEEFKQVSTPDCNIGLEKHISAGTPLLCNIGDFKLSIPGSNRFIQKSIADGGIALNTRTTDRVADKVSQSGGFVESKSEDALGRYIEPLSASLVGISGNEEDRPFSFVPLEMPAAVPFAYITTSQSEQNLVDTYKCKKKKVGYCPKNPPDVKAILTGHQSRNIAVLSPTDINKVNGKAKKALGRGKKRKRSFTSISPVRKQGLSPSIGLKGVDENETSLAHNHKLVKCPKTASEKTRWGSLFVTNSPKSKPNQMLAAATTKAESFRQPRLARGTTFIVRTVPENEALGHVGKHAASAPICPSRMLDVGVSHATGPGARDTLWSVPVLPGAAQTRGRGTFNLDAVQARKPEDSLVVGSLGELRNMACVSKLKSVFDQLTVNNAKQIPSPKASKPVSVHSDTKSCLQNQNLAFGEIQRVTCPDKLNDLPEDMISPKDEIDTGNCYVQNSPGLILNVDKGESNDKFLSKARADTISKKVYSDMSPHNILSVNEFLTPGPTPGDSSITASCLRPGTLHFLNFLVPSGIQRPSFSFLGSGVSTGADEAGKGLASTEANQSTTPPDSLRKYQEGQERTKSCAEKEEFLKTRTDTHIFTTCRDPPEKEATGKKVDCSSEHWCQNIQKYADGQGYEGSYDKPSSYSFLPCRDNPKKNNDCSRSPDNAQGTTTTSDLGKFEPEKKHSEKLQSCLNSDEVQRKQEGSFIPPSDPSLEKLYTVAKELLTSSRQPRENQSPHGDSGQGSQEEQPCLSCSVESIKRVTIQEHHPLPAATFEDSVLIKPDVDYEVEDFKPGCEGASRQASSKVSAQDEQSRETAPLLAQKDASSKIERFSEKHTSPNSQLPRDHCLFYRQSSSRSSSTSDCPKIKAVKTNLRSETSSHNYIANRSRDNVCQARKDNSGSHRLSPRSKHCELSPAKRDKESSTNLCRHRSHSNSKHSQASPTSACREGSAKADSTQSEKLQQRKATKSPNCCRSHSSISSVSLSDNGTDLDCSWTCACGQAPSPCVDCCSPGEAGHTDGGSDGESECERYWGEHSLNNTALSQSISPLPSREDEINEVTEIYGSGSSSLCLLGNTSPASCRSENELRCLNQSKSSNKCPVTCCCSDCINLYVKTRPAEGSGPANQPVLRDAPQQTNTLLHSPREGMGEREGNDDFREVWEKLYPTSLERESNGRRCPCEKAARKEKQDQGLGKLEIPDDSAKDDELDEASRKKRTQRFENRRNKTRQSEKSQKLKHENLSRGSPEGEISSEDSCNQEEEMKCRCLCDSRCKYCSIPSRNKRMSCICEPIHQRCNSKDCTSIPRQQKGNQRSTRKMGTTGCYEHDRKCHELPARARCFCAREKASNSCCSHLLINRQRHFSCCCCKKRPKCQRKGNYACCKHPHSEKGRNTARSLFCLSDERLCSGRHQSDDSETSQSEEERLENIIKLCSAIATVYVNTYDNLEKKQSIEDPCKRQHGQSKTNLKTANHKKSKRFKPKPHRDHETYKCRCRHSPSSLAGSQKKCGKRAKSATLTGPDDVLSTKSKKHSDLKKKSKKTRSPSTKSVSSATLDSTEDEASQQESLVKQRKRSKKTRSSSTKSISSATSDGTEKGKSGKKRDVKKRKKSKTPRSSRSRGTSQSETSGTSQSTSGDSSDHISGSSREGSSSTHRRKTAVKQRKGISKKNTSKATQVHQNKSLVNKRRITSALCDQTKRLLQLEQNIDHDIMERICFLRNHFLHRSPSSVYPCKPNISYTAGQNREISRSGVGPHALACNVAFPEKTRSMCSPPKETLNTQRRSPYVSLISRCLNPPSAVPRSPPLRGTVCPQRESPTGGSYDVPFPNSYHALKEGQNVSSLTSPPPPPLSASRQSAIEQQANSTRYLSNRPCSNSFGATSPLKNEYPRFGSKLCPHGLVNRRCCQSTCSRMYRTGDSSLRAGTSRINQRDLPSCSDSRKNMTQNSQTLSTRSRRQQGVENSWKMQSLDNRRGYSSANFTEAMRDQEGRRHSQAVASEVMLRKSHLCWDSPENSMLIRSLSPGEKMAGKNRVEDGSCPRNHETTFLSSLLGCGVCRHLLENREAVLSKCDLNTREKAHNFEEDCCLHECERHSPELKKLEKVFGVSKEELTSNHKLDVNGEETNNGFGTSVERRPEDGGHRLSPKISAATRATKVETINIKSSGSNDKPSKDLETDTQEVEQSQIVRAYSSIMDKFRESNAPSVTNVNVKGGVESYENPLSCGHETSLSPRNGQSSFQNSDEVVQTIEGDQHSDEERPTKLVLSKSNDNNSHHIISSQRCIPILRNIYEEDTEKENKDPVNSLTTVSSKPSPHSLDSGNILSKVQSLASKKNDALGETSCFTFTKPEHANTENTHKENSVSLHDISNQKTSNNNSTVRCITVVPKNSDVNSRVEITLVSNCMSDDAKASRLDSVAKDDVSFCHVHWENNRAEEDDIVIDLENCEDM